MVVARIYDTIYSRSAMSMSVPAQEDYAPVICAFGEANLSILAFISTLLTNKRYKNHALVKDLVGNAKTVLAHILRGDAQDKACASVESIYVQEIRDLANAKSGWHFSAWHADPQDIEDFGFDDMSNDYARLAPRVYQLTCLLSMLLVSFSHKCYTYGSTDLYNKT
jgi:hypothetical protein